MVITEKEKEKTLIIMCLHLKNDSRINNTSKMTLRCKVPSLGTSLGHNTIEFSASTLIAVSTILKQTNVLAKRDFLGMYSMYKFVSKYMILKNEKSFFSLYLKGTNTPWVGTQMGGDGGGLSENLS